MRFNKPAFATVHFSEKIWVRCPDCNDIGLVTTELGRYNIPQPSGYKTQFHCTNCDLKITDNTDWYGYCQGTIYQACGFCGSRIYFTSKPTKELYRTTNIECDICKKEKEYEIKWYRFQQEKPTDPFFGFELWLQATVKSNILWLYNLEHLNYLREYVGAKLREDDGRHKYSMITNLAQWITSAKNRDIIIKKLNKLEIELQRKTEHNM